MDNLLNVSNLNVRIPGRVQDAHILRDVSLNIEPGEVCAVVGESGSGKSTLLRALVRLLPEGGIQTGEVQYEGRDLVVASSETIRGFRRSHARMIFQDPWGSMHPMRSIGAQLAESVNAATPGLARRDVQSRILAALEAVGVTEAASRLRGYPHQLSGGQLQRIMIAMALLAKPKILLCDEPTTALDVTTQATILDLLGELADSEGIAVVIATHDLQTIRTVADKVIVMYAGQIVEVGTTQDVLNAPRHPYTYALLMAAPRMDLSVPLLHIEGIAPAPFESGMGCAFAPRCRHADPDCQVSDPELRVVVDGPPHLTACLRAVGYREASGWEPASVGES